MINNDWQQKKCLTFEEIQFEGKDCLFVSYFYLLSFSFWGTQKDKRSNKLWLQCDAAYHSCRDASVHQLVDWNKTNLHPFWWSNNRLDIFQAKAPNVCSFQLLKSEDLLLLFVTPDTKEQIWFEFWIVDPTKRDIFLLFWHFIHWENIRWCIYWISWKHFSLSNIFPLWKQKMKHEVHSETRRLTAEEALTWDMSTSSTERRGFPQKDKRQRSHMITEQLQLRTPDGSVWTERRREKPAKVTAGCEGNLESWLRFRRAGCRIWPRPQTAGSQNDTSSLL